MPLAANTATVQILDDNASHVVAKFQFFQHTANATSHEASVEKINCNALVCRTMTFTGTTDAPPLWPGDQVTQVSNTAITGTVASWRGNNATIVLGTPGALFANSEVVQFSRGTTNTYTWTLTSAGAVLDTPELALRQIEWSVAGNTATRVALEWAGNPNTEIVQVGTGGGYWGKNALATNIPNNANAATGHVNISTYSTPALSGYTIIAEFAKVKGFAPQGQ